MKTKRGWRRLGAAGLGLLLATATGCQTWVPEPGLTLPTGWYLKHLGVGAPEGEYIWTQQAGPTVFAPFENDSDYFAANKPFMLNLRVDDLDGLIASLEAAGINKDAAVTLRLKDVSFEVALGYLAREVGGSQVALHSSGCGSGPRGDRRSNRSQAVQSTRGGPVRRGFLGKFCGKFLCVLHRACFGKFYGTTGTTETTEPSGKVSGGSRDCGQALCAEARHHESKSRSRCSAS